MAAAGPPPSSASTPTSPSLEDEIAQSRLERIHRRSRLIERGIVKDGIVKDGIVKDGTGSGNGSNGAVGTSGSDDIVQSYDDRKPTGTNISTTASSMSTASDSASNSAARSTNVLSRYGGQAGPTGATHAPAGGPVSLANFIGGKAAGPRLGKLQGDGRSAPPEAETFLREHDGSSPMRRGIALPGLAPTSATPQETDAKGASPSSPNKPLAAFLAARANAMGSSTSTSTSSAPLPRLSPTKEMGPPSAFARSLANAGSSAASTPSSVDAQAATPDVAATPTPIAQQTTGGGTPISAAGVSLVRRPSQSKKLSSTAMETAPKAFQGEVPSPAPAASSPPKRGWTLTEPSPASAPSSATTIASQTSVVQSPTPNSTTSASTTSDKFPTASLSRLSAKGMVGQRIREAQERQLSGSATSTDGPTSPSTTSPAAGLAALRDRWAHGAKAGTLASAPAGLTLPSSQAVNDRVPGRLSPQKEWSAPSFSASSPTPASVGASSPPMENPWRPGRFANALPGLVKDSAAAASSPGPAERGGAQGQKSVESSEPRSPVRLPGLGGPMPPAALGADRSFHASSSGSGDPAAVAVDSVRNDSPATSAEVQVLKPLTANRPRGAAMRKSRGTASTVAAPTSKYEEISIPSFSPPTPVGPATGLLDDTADSPLARNPLPRPPSPDKNAYAATNVPPPSRGALPSQSQTIEKRAEPAKGRRSTSGKRILVLISGSGTNFQALIDATIPALGGGIPNAQIVGVISNRKAAFGLERARAADPPIPAVVFSLKAFKDQVGSSASRDEYDEALAKLALTYKPDIIVLAGFMHIVSPRFLGVLGHGDNTVTSGDKAPVPIINLHPALPGQFDGAHAIERAYDAYQAGHIDHTGVMVHEVIAQVDAGAPIIVEKVAMDGLRSLAELEDRIHAVEHRIIVEGTRKVLERRGSITITPGTSPIQERKATSTVQPKVDVNAVVAAVQAFRKTHATSKGEPPAGAYSQSAPAMFAVRRVGAATTIQAIPVATSSLCSAQSAIIILAGAVFVWHGHGSTSAQRQSAEQFANKLLRSGPDASSNRGSRVRINEEGAEDDLFRNQLDLKTGAEGYASAWHHRHAPLLSNEQAVPVLIRLRPEQATPEPPQLATLSALQLNDDGTDQGGEPLVSVLDLTLEAYVIVSARARGCKAHILAAIDLAETLAKAAASATQSALPGRTNAVHVVVLPGQLPRDLRAAVGSASPSRIGQDGSRSAPQRLNAHEAQEARAQLAKGVGAFTRAELADKDYLPVGVAPEDLTQP